MLGTRDSGETRHDLRRELQGIQVTPATCRRMIVPLRRGTALGAREGDCTFLDDVDVACRFLHVEVNVTDGPRRNEAKKL